MKNGMKYFAVQAMHEGRKTEVRSAVGVSEELRWRCDRIKDRPRVASCSLW